MNVFKSIKENTVTVFQKTLGNNLFRIFSRIEKRIRLLISILILLVMMVISTLYSFDRAPFFLILLVSVTYFLTYFSLLEGIEGIEWGMLFMMPIMISVSFYLFYFLFPVRWLTRLPFIFIYVISVYATLLTSNIFNVGVEKSLQLYRAAFSVNYFYQSLIIFLFSNLLLSLKLNFIMNGVSFFLLSLVLSAHLFWSIRLRLRLDPEVIKYSILVAAIIGEIALMLSFLPIKISIFSLFITAVYYSLGGLTYAFIDQRLFKETIREYLIVLGFVIVITLLTISW